MDIWYFSRKNLAQKYIKVLDAGFSSNIAIIAPRRMGKTLFILSDISTVAKDKNYLPVYASLWQNINAPHEGIILALEEAIKALEKHIPFSNLLKTNIKKTAIGNEFVGKLEVEFADRPQEPSKEALTRMDQLLSELEKKAKKKTILLLIDEIQHLATSSKFNALAHTLRTMLDKRLGNVKAIFTGSSRHYMDLLFNESLSPFYHFVERLPFDNLGEDFINFLRENLKKRHNIDTSHSELMEAFKQVGSSPYWMMKIVSHMVTFEQSLAASVDYVLALINAAEDYDRTAQKLKSIDKIVFLAIALEQSPYSAELLEKISNETAYKGRKSNVQRSLSRLADMHLISQRGKGLYVIENSGFYEFLKEHES